MEVLSTEAESSSCKVTKIKQDGLTVIELGYEDDEIPVYAVFHINPVTGKPLAEVAEEIDKYHKNSVNCIGMVEYGEGLSVIDSILLIGTLS